MMVELKGMNYHQIQIKLVCRRCFLEVFLHVTRKIFIEIKLKEHN